MKIEAIVKDTYADKYKDALITITEDVDALSPFYMMRADDEVKDEYVQIVVNSRKDLCDLMQGKQRYNNRYLITELGSCLGRKGMGVKYLLPERVEEYGGIKFKTDPAGHKIARMRVTGGPGAATELLINLGPADISMFTENAPLYSDHTSIKPAICILPFGLYIGKPPHTRGGGHN